MKKCRKCESIFEGRDCKLCKADYMRKWNALNPEKVKKSREKKYKNNKEKYLEKNKEWAKNNREKSNAIKKAYKERNRELYLFQQREYAKKRYLSNRDEILFKEKTPERVEIFKEWYKKNRVRLNKRCMERYHLNIELRIKYKARNKVYRAIKNGTLVKPLNCEKCLLQVNLQAHHENYQEPLMVNWLCRSCHYKLHRKIN